MLCVLETSQGHCDWFKEEEEDIGDDLTGGGPSLLGRQ